MANPVDAHERSSVDNRILAQRQGGSDGPPAQPYENNVTDEGDTKSLKSTGDGVNGSSSLSTYSSTSDLPLLAERQGDVISSHKALLTLAKGFVGTGCLSLPYAWKLGGLWVSFVLQFLISGLNWYSNHILARSAQYLAAKYVVNTTVLLYQLGCSSVPIVFVGTNLSKLISSYFHFDMSTTFYATAILLPLMAANMLATMRSISYLAIAATALWLFGAISMLQQCFRMPSQWNTLPAYTDWWSTIMFFGTAMYSYEGQTMILPVENSMRHPEDFTANFGVLPTLMVLVTALYTSLGFYGYTAYGAETASTLPLNMPHTTLFTIVTVMLILMAFLAHPVNLYVVFDMFWPGFRRKFPNRFSYWQERTKTLDILFRAFWVFVTYIIAVFVPRIEQIVSLVGITGGSLCAFVYPPILEILTFRTIWTLKCSRKYVAMKMTINILLIILGILLCVFGLYVNVLEIYRSL